MTSDVTLDLSYRSAPPPPDLADRARRTGARMRRRRRTATTGLAGAAALVLLAGSVVALQSGPDEAQTDVAVPVDGLPAYAGPLRSLAGLALPGRTVVGPEDPDIAFAQEPLDGVRLVSRDRPTAHWTVYVSEDLKLCIRGQDPTQPVAPMGTGSCTSPTTLPEAGFGFLVLVGTNDRPGEDDAYFRLAGLVTGPITRVVLSSPSGEVEGSLQPAPRPELGQLLYVRTDAPYSTTDPRADVEGSRLVAYEGDRPVFACALTAAEQTCTPPQQVLPTR